MGDSERWKKGHEKIIDVYAGDVITAPEGAYPFSDIMLETLFAEIWTRDVLSMREKRILLLGMIAAQGQPDTFKIQAKASIKRGEMTPEEIRELHIFIAQYCGYPKAAALVMPMETAISEAQKDLEGDDLEGESQETES